MSDQVHLQFHPQLPHMCHIASNKRRLQQKRHSLHLVIILSAGISDLGIMQQTGQWFLHRGFVTGSVRLGREHVRGLLWRSSLCGRRSY